MTHKFWVNLATFSIGDITGFKAVVSVCQRMVLGYCCFNAMPVCGQRLDQFGCH